MEGIIPDLSIVVPVYNEKENLEHLYERLKTVLAPLGHSYELIFVDDGSSDSTLDVLKSFQKQDGNVRILSFSRNFGHQIALTAGLDYASGKAVISLDADLQHPPELIPELVKRWKDGYDVVYTVRMDSGDTSWFKRITSKVFYRLMNFFSHTHIPEGGADFRLLNRRAVDTLKNIRERNRMLRGLVGWIGFNQIALPYQAAPRRGGAPKYSLLRMARLAMDGLTSFSSAPLYLATIFGFIVSIFSFLYAAYVLYARFFTDMTVPGWTSLVVVVLFLGGVQLICLGIMGEYIGKIYSEMKNRPLYLVRESIGFPGAV